MAAIDGLPIGSTDDAETTAFQNKLTIRKASEFLSLGGHSGILDGWAYSTVAGQMQLSVAVGSGMVAARNASQVEQKWGYVAQTRAATIVQFGAASVASRKDALVFAACDPQEAGTFPGAGGALAAGFHLVAVPGTSGVTTALTDAAIATYLGSGGFHRIADVLIPNATTQISSGNITFTGFKVNDWNTLTEVTAASGWSLTYARYMLFGMLPMCRISLWLVRTGGTISADSEGNFGDVLVAQNLRTSLRAVGDPAYGTFVVPGRILGSARVETDGQISITDMYPTADIVGTDNLRIDFNYALV